MAVRAGVGAGRSHAARVGPSRRLAIVLACLAVLAPAPARAFKAADFKTCATSSFCARHRHRAAGASADTYAIVGSFAATSDASAPGAPPSSSFIATLADANAPDAPLTLAVTSVGEEGVVRVRVDDPRRPRYRVPDVLDPAFASRVSPFARVTREERPAAAGGTVTVFRTPNPAVAVEVRHAPLRVALLVNGVETVVFNDRAALAYERADVLASTPPAADGGGEGKSADWSETFNGHVDARPNGPNALAFDVTFPGATRAYGLPERATSLNLRDTVAPAAAETAREDSDAGADRSEVALSEPYRLYNLDVFEYEHDSPFGLYGSIPVLLAHAPDRLDARNDDAAAAGGGGAKTSATSAAYFHNPTETYVDLTRRGETETTPGASSTPLVSSRWMAESGALDVFLIPGPSPSAVLRQYASLTGATALPPAFALGYHQCRWNYRDEADVAETDAGFDERDIPYDVLWLDIEHTDGKRYMTWDAAHFPTPRRMIEDVASRGRKMVAIVDPHVKRDPNYPAYEEARKRGFFVKKSDGATDFDGWCWPGASAYLDVTSAEVRAWWAEKFAPENYPGSTRDLHVWNDMNEPSVFNGPEVTMQKDLVHAGGVEHREVHNAFGMYYHAATAEGLRRRGLDPAPGEEKEGSAASTLSSWGKRTSRNRGSREESDALRSRAPLTPRPFVLSRAFFAGTQRIGPVWTGDNAADWDHLRVSVPMCLTLGLSGLTFSGADVGGFFGDPSPELAVRWYQLGAHYPFFRGHAHLDTKRREPWRFGDEHTATIRDAIRRRYQLAPYLYTLFEDAAATGAPVMRPTWYEFPEDPDAFETQESFMLGPALLVAPVLREGAEEVRVYLPTEEKEAEKEGKGGGPAKGTAVWYDHDTGEAYEGGKTHAIAVTMESVPTFVRGGFIVSRRDRPRRGTKAQAADPVTLVVAPDARGRAAGELYLDDGETDAHEAAKGARFARRAFEYREDEAEATLRGGAAARDPGAGGTFPGAEAKVERVIVLGGRARALRFERADVAEAGAAGGGMTREVEVGCEGRFETIVRNPGVRVAGEWVVTMR